MKSKIVVEPLRARLGVPQPCPKCGGQLAPAFGMIVEDDGTQRPVLDETTVRCRECDTYFPVRQDPMHISEIIALVQSSQLVDVTTCAEEHPQTRRQFLLVSNGTVIADVTIQWR